MLRKEAIEYLRRRQQKEVLEKCRRIAVLGASTNPHSPSYLRIEKLLGLGVEIIPILKGKDRYLGMPCYPHLKEVPGHVDIVQVYPTEEFDLNELARQTVEKGAKAFWVEEDGVEQEAKEILAQGKVQLVEQESLAQEYARHFPFTGPGAEAIRRTRAATVGDRMTRNPVTVEPRESLNDAMVKLKKGGFRHLPVVDDKGELVGMLSDRDIRLIRPSRAFASLQESELRMWSSAVEQAAVFNPVTVESDGLLISAADKMLRWGVGALPVVDKKGRLEGIITYSDLLRELIAIGG